VGDGDTLDVRPGVRVRLVQIDAPELGEGECYARESRRELERLAAPGKQIELESDPELDDTDRYGRLLRYVHAADANVNVELVRRGAAAPYFRRGDEGTYASELLDAVGDARKASRGMWGSCRVAWNPERAVTTRPR
jgi:micrococcal nuclease